MKKISLLLFLLYIFSGCLRAQDCPQGINLLPMYGGIKKCKEQVELDKEFIASADKQYNRREDAAKHMVQCGWEYLAEQKLDTAMMRFNQAWLLDSLNYQIYWGFGNLLGIQQKFKQSLPFFNKSVKLNPNDSRLLQDASVGYGNTYLVTKKLVYIDTAIAMLKNAAKIEPNNAGLYAQIAAAYAYTPKHDSTRRYTNITHRLNPAAVPPHLKSLVSNK